MLENFAEKKMLRLPKTLKESQICFMGGIKGETVGVPSQGFDSYSPKEPPLMLFYDIYCWPTNLKR